MEFEFWKMHGTGNDFIVVNNFDLRYSFWQPPVVKEICQWHTGVGADGLLLLEPSAKADFRMRYFNADGYESTMCVIKKGLLSSRHVLRQKMEYTGYI
jgi:diaminopimelate epimerase